MTSSLTKMGWTTLSWPRCRATACAAKPNAMMTNPKIHTERRTMCRTSPREGPWAGGASSTPNRWQMLATAFAREARRARQTTTVRAYGAPSRGFDTRLIRRAQRIAPRRETIPGRRFEVTVVGGTCPLT